MIDLQNLRLEDIAPDSIKIPDVLAFFNALDPELQKITKDIGEALIMTRIDELPEEIVDLLAWQLHVDFYEPLGLDLDRKRALVKNSLIWHRYKGTKYVLEDMIRILFFDNFKIEEWFEYDGRPYFFRLISHDILTDPKQYHDLIRAIYLLKNERSWLDGLTFHLETVSTMHIGITGRTTERIEIDGFAPQPSVEDISVRLGITGKQTTRIEIGGTFADNSSINPILTLMGIIGRQTEHLFVDVESISAVETSITTTAGFTGKQTERIEIGASDAPQVDVADARLQTAVTHKYITKIFIDSEEVENGNI